jgi:hypothetical protein
MISSSWVFSLCFSRISTIDIYSDKIETMLNKKMTEGSLLMEIDEGEKFIIKESHFHKRYDKRIYMLSKRYEDY